MAPLPSNFTKESMNEVVRPNKALNLDYIIQRNLDAACSSEEHSNSMWITFMFKVLGSTTLNNHHHHGPWTIVLPVKVRPWDICCLGIRWLQFFIITFSPFEKKPSFTGLSALNCWMHKHCEGAHWIINRLWLIYGQSWHWCYLSKYLISNNIEAILENQLWAAADCPLRTLLCIFWHLDHTATRL